eukprot:7751915-Pyramimonas_sp.AAC.1
MCRVSPAGVMPGVPRAWAGCAPQMCPCRCANVTQTQTLHTIRSPVTDRRCDSYVTPTGMMRYIRVTPRGPRAPGRSLGASPSSRPSDRNCFEGRRGRSALAPARR